MNSSVFLAGACIVLGMLASIVLIRNAWIAADVLFCVAILMSVRDMVKNGWRPVPVFEVVAAILLAGIVTIMEYV